MELTPIKLNDFKDFISTKFGRDAVGLNVLSTGKSNPILLISVLLIFPIEELEDSNIAPTPNVEVIVVIPGSDK